MRAHQCGHKRFYVVVHRVMLICSIQQVLPYTEQVGLLCRCFLLSVNRLVSVVWCGMAGLTCRVLVASQRNILVTSPPRASLVRPKPVLIYLPLLRKIEKILPHSTRGLAKSFTPSMFFSARHPPHVPRCIPPFSHLVLFLSRVLFS